MKAAELSQRMPALSPAKLTALKANVFSAAHQAIDWHSFDWHRHRQEVTADRPNSSQALALDVFGSIKAAPEQQRSAILDALAEVAGLPAGGPWTVELEWCDPVNLLHEPRQTQIDAIAFGAHAIMVIECKFTEAGGSCSQTNKLTSGPAKGQRQCNGNYQLQSHPVTGATARCTLSGKGIRYWRTIPQVFDLDPEADHVPCPFKGEAFQWMRNMVLAAELGRHHGKASRCVIAYAAGGGFPTEAKVRDLGWLPPLRGGALEPFLISYQAIAMIAQDESPDACWPELRSWIDGKVAVVKDQRSGSTT